MVVYRVKKIIAWVLAFLVILLLVAGAWWLVTLV